MTADTTATLNARELVERSEKKLEALFESIERTAIARQRQVLDAFREKRVTEEFFADKTGYAIDDAGREVLDEIMAILCGCEAAAIRMQFVSGTHALACAILGNTNAGDKVVILTGTPYDSLQPVFGITDDEPGSLKKLGGSYEIIDVGPTLAADKLESASLKSALAAQIAKSAPAKIYFIQKSRGYSMERKTYSNAEIKAMVEAVRSIDKNSLIIVDNCYGEFVEDAEPASLGIDLMAGSMIKNPGGGLAIAGGYLAGTRAAVDAALNRLTAPGVGGHMGHSYSQNRLIFQGLFMAPSVVASALKGAILIASVFEQLGFKVGPASSEPRHDIIQSVELGSREKLINFCRALQRFSPVNAHVDPEPADMPGYQDQIIMAGGTFVEGSTIEFSADGPLRPPYAAYIQGGLSYIHVKCALEGVLSLSLSGELPFFRV